MVGAGVAPAILLLVEESRESRDSKERKEMSLQVGMYVAWALGEENAPELNARIGGRVSPVVQPEDGGTVLPYVWYYSTGVQESVAKDGRIGDECQVDIEVVARSYSEMTELAQMVRSAMERALEMWDGGPFVVDGQMFSAGPEEYDDMMQAYCRKLNYIIETYEEN